MYTATRRRRTNALSIVALVSGVAAALAMWFLWPEDDPHGIAPAFSTIDDWPPAPEQDEAQELATAAWMASAMEYGVLPDGSVEGLDAGVLRYGHTSGEMHVRPGYEEGLFFLEVVMGAEASFDEPMPMAVVIHGRGDRARTPGGPFLHLGAPLRVIVPQAPDPLGDGYEWLPVRVGSGLVDQLTTSLIARAGQLARMLRTLRGSRPTVGNTIVVGFSQGGLLTFTLATHFSDVVGAAFPLAAWLPPALVPPYRRDDIAYPPIRGMHGDADRVVPYDGTREVFATLEERGFDVTFVSFPEIGHEMTEEMNRQLRTWLQETVGAVVDDGIATGVLDGGTPPLCVGDGGPAGCLDACPTFDGGVPEGGVDALPCLAPCGDDPDGGLCLRGDAPGRRADAGVSEAGAAEAGAAEAGAAEAGAAEAGATEGDDDAGRTRRDP
jgi:predicted esterase